MEVPKHAEIYAKVCEVLSKKKVKTEWIEEEPSNTSDFKSMMITRCQKEFEQDFVEVSDEKKLETDLETPYSLCQDRKRCSVGNIRFIGELYNCGMLSDRIMHEIIQNLLTVSVKEALECLCWLLRTSGKILEEATNMRFASQYNSDPVSVFEA